MFQTNDSWTHSGVCTPWGNWGRPTRPFQISSDSRGGCYLTESDIGSRQFMGLVASWQCQTSGNVWVWDPQLGLLVYLEAKIHPVSKHTPSRSGWCKSDLEFRVFSQPCITLNFHQYKYRCRLLRSIATSTQLWMQSLFLLLKHVNPNQCIQFVQAALPKLPNSDLNYKIRSVGCSRESRAAPTLARNSPRQSEIAPKMTKHGVFRFPPSRNLVKRTAKSAK